MISGFKVVFLSIMLLKVEFFFQVDIRDIGAKLDNIIPKLFLFLIGLFDAADGHIWGWKDALESIFEGLADKFLLLGISCLSAL